MAVAPRRRCRGPGGQGDDSVSIYAAISLSLLERTHNVLCYPHAGIEGSTRELYESVKVAAKVDLIAVPCERSSIVSSRRW